MRAVDAMNETARPLEVYRFMHELEQSSSTPIDQKTLSQIETAVTPLLAQGIPAEQVAAGYRSWQASDSFSTTQIAAFVHKAGARASAPSSTADERVAQAQSLKLRPATLGPLPDWSCHDPDPRRRHRCPHRSRIGRPPQDR
ncbi:hypothetical protein GS887_27785 [Rhodococcus hoagii]|nr:hypothetical protein [Prescottella equi]